MSRTPIIGGTKGRAPVVDYNKAETETLAYAERQIALMEFELAKKIGHKLVEVYPGRQWGVDVDAKNQTVIISCPSLSTKSGYYLHMRDGTVHGLQHRAIIAAGEILERFGVTRGKTVDPNIFDHMPQDVRGNVIAPDAAPEPLH